MLKAITFRVGEFVKSGPVVGQVEEILGNGKIRVFGGEYELNRLDLFDLSADKCVRIDKPGCWDERTTPK